MGTSAGRIWKSGTKVKGQVSKQVKDAVLSRCHPPNTKTINICHLSLL